MPNENELRPEWFEAQREDVCKVLSLAVARLLETDDQMTLAHVREALAILGEKERYQVTIADLYGAVERDYLTHGRKTLRNIKCVWKNHLKAAFGQLQAASLSSDQVIIYIAQRQAEGAKNATINRETSGLARMFTLAIQTGKLTRKPYIPHLDERDNVRRGFVKDAQFDALARELSASDGLLWLRALLEIGFVFGFRKSELLRLRVRQFDLLERTITLEAGETKNGEGRQVELTDQAFDLLQQCVAGKDQEAFVFTRNHESNGRRTKTRDGHIVDFRDDWARVCCKVGLGAMFCAECRELEEFEPSNWFGNSPLGPDEKRCGACRRPGSNGLGYRGLLVHDLRRSAVRNLIRAGVAQKTAQTISGHRTPSTFQRYNIIDQADLSDAARKLQNAATRRREQGL